MVRQTFLAIRTTIAWNQLPAEVVNVPSLNAFKTRLDKARSRWNYGQQPVNAFFHYDSASLGREAKHGYAEEDTYKNVYMSSMVAIL